MIEIAILGHGVVGTGTARMIDDNAERLKKLTGDTVHVKYILDIRDLPDSPWADRIVHDYSVILNDPEVRVVAELIGGSHPAFDFELSALQAGKHVVTSNKECVSKFGVELSEAAVKAGVSFRFEASCGGGIPLLTPLMRDLSVNRITEIGGILNGTTNYILTKMFCDNAAFSDALTEAQQKGYAERNPEADIEGIDARRKINIISACVTGELHDDDHIFTEGITKIRCADVRNAHKDGYAIKLLGRMSGKHLFVAPHLVSYDCPLAHIDDVFNGVLVSGNYVGDVMFYGRGAGAEATASAVVADIVAAVTESPSKTVWSKATQTQDFSDFTCPRYFVCDENDGALLRETVSVPFRRLSANEGELAFLTEPLSETEAAAVAASVPLRAHLRVR